jgi:hypothetical protein
VSKKAKKCLKAERFMFTSMKRTAVVWENGASTKKGMRATRVEQGVHDAELAEKRLQGL